MKVALCTLLSKRIRCPAHVIDYSQGFSETRASFSPPQMVNKQARHVKCYISESSDLKQDLSDSDSKLTFESSYCHLHLELPASLDRPSSSRHSGHSIRCHPNNAPDHATSSNQAMLGIHPKRSLQLQLVPWTAPAQLRLSNPSGCFPWDTRRQCSC